MVEWHADPVGNIVCRVFDHGISAVLIGTPTRSTHTATEMVEESDVTAPVNLLRAFVMKSPTR